ncbi:MAG: hypothetical protein PHW07_00460 [Sulfurospirillaceae bacterium]|nr:hypothetical protein [Sulfurospirillaceae bacterium]
MNRFKEELIVYLVLLLFLALFMHMAQWITHPIAHLKALGHHKMPYHPLLYSFAIYLAILPFRYIYKFFKRFFR